MCLKQILFDEHIALIGHAAASDPAVARQSWRVPGIHFPCTQEHADMAKAQKRSTREVRKPKAAKAKTTPVALANSPVNTLMQKPKGKV